MAVTLAWSLRASGSLSRRAEMVSMLLAVNWKRETVGVVDCVEESPSVQAS
jgi:hypothetical protein